MKPYTFLLFSLLVTVSPAFSQTTSGTTSEYRNNTYKFILQIPTDWKLYGQIKNDTIRHKAIADWGLPVTHSTLENADIENSISMTAYHRTDITNLEQLITADRLRTDTANTIFQKDAQDVNARIIIFTDRGLKYKGKSYYKFKNGIGYVINFTATPGTYEKNLPLFENFYNNVRYE